MKVYVIEVGAYSDRYLDIIFTTRELAEAYIDNRRHRDYDSERAVHEKMWEPFPPDVRPSLMSQWPRTFPDFDQWLKVVENQWGRDFGDVTEYDLWDELPIADAVA